jgi:hypothetical protein
VGDDVAGTTTLKRTRRPNSTEDFVVIIISINRVIIVSQVKTLFVDGWMSLNKVVEDDECLEKSPENRPCFYIAQNPTCDILLRHNHDAEKLTV